MNQLQSDYWITSLPFFVFAKSQFLRLITNGFITSRSQTYPQFGIIRRTGDERLRNGKEKLPFQLFIEGSRDRRDPHDGHKDGEAEPGRFRKIHCLCPHTAWEDQPGRHRQPSSVVRNPSERGEIIEIRGTEERCG